APPGIERGIAWWRAGAVGPPLVLMSPRKRWNVICCPPMPVYATLRSTSMWSISQDVAGPYNCVKAACASWQGAVGLIAALGVNTYENGLIPLTVPTSTPLAAHGLSKGVGSEPAPSRPS